MPYVESKGPAALLVSSSERCREKWEPRSANSPVHPRSGAYELSQGFSSLGHRIRRSSQQHVQEFEQASHEVSVLQRSEDLCLLVSMGLKRSNTVPHPRYVLRQANTYIVIRNHRRASQKTAQKSEEYAISTMREQIHGCSWMNTCLVHRLSKTLVFLFHSSSSFGKNHM